MSTHNNNLDILKPLTEKELKGKNLNLERENNQKIIPILPIPEDAIPFSRSACSYNNKKFGKEPDHIYDYRDADGSLFMYIVRWDNITQKNGHTKKEIRPYIYGKDKDGKLGWHSQFPDQRRPLYNLSTLSSNPQAPILFVEGEKTAETAKKLFPDYVETTTSGGSNAAHNTDFSPVKGRHVIISPDCGKAGANYAEQVGKLCKQAGASSIQIFNTEALSKLIVINGEVTERQDKAKKNYDLADALEEGWTATLIKQHLNQFLEEQIGPYELKREGVYKDGKYLFPFIKVTNQISDNKGNCWSKVVIFYNPKRQLKTEIIPDEMLANDGKELREQLAKAGFSVPPTKNHREELNNYLYSSKPLKFATSIKKIGWYRQKIYVLPDRIYGNEEAREEHIQQLKRGHTPNIEIKGTLKEWQENVARYAIGNSHLIMAIVTPLTAPFLTPMQIDGHIFNLYGNSSIGKSSALAVASSVTGFEMVDFHKTNNAFESIFVAHNDACVIIDDLALSIPAQIGNFVYIAINGNTKGRASQKGEGLETFSFKNNGLISGEKTLAGKMAEAQQKPTAGQEVRFVDIPADAGQGLGVFENVQGMTPSNFSEYLKRMSKEYKGIAFDSLLEYLVSQPWDEIANRLSSFIENFKSKHLQSLKNNIASGQIQRVLTYFALHAAVGEFCINLRILPWKEGTVIDAYSNLFKNWLDQRGSSKDSKELLEVISNLRQLIEQQNSRFDIQEDNEADNCIKTALNHKRAGIIKKDIFCIFSDVFEKEIIAGKDKRVILPELINRGILKIDSEKKPQIKTRLHDGSSKRMYHVVSSVLEEQDIF